MAVKLGMFTMPFHNPARDYATILEEDQEAIILADRLGFTEVFVGEHFSSWSERITCGGSDTEGSWSTGPRPEGADTRRRSRCEAGVRRPTLADGHSTRFSQ